MKNWVFKVCLKEYRVGESWTGWGRKFQSMGEALKVSMGGGDEGIRGVEQDVLGGEKRMVWLVF